MCSTSPCSIASDSFGTCAPCSAKTTWNPRLADESPAVGGGVGGKGDYAKWVSTSPRLEAGWSENFMDLEIEPMNTFRIRLVVAALFTSFG